MDYKIMINEFEGPMDLLLHLIKKSDIDICDISVEEITKQYLDYMLLDTQNPTDTHTLSSYIKY